MLLIQLFSRSLCGLFGSVLFMWCVGLLVFWLLFVGGFVCLVWFGFIIQSPG